MLHLDSEMDMDFFKPSHGRNFVGHGQKFEKYK